MPFSSVFLLRILKTARQSEEALGAMSIIVREPYGHLEHELRRAFEQQDDVKVIVDRRRTERRASRQPGALERRLERRQTDRRRPRQELIEVVISG